MSAVRMGGGRQSREIYSSSSKAKDEKPRNGLCFFKSRAVKQSQQRLRRKILKAKRRW